MNKTELIEAMAKQAGLSKKDADAALSFRCIHRCCC